MHKLIVTLPRNRDFEGSLRLEDHNGRLLAGPFAVCGRADGEMARRYGNSSRQTVLPFGDTPLGRYRMAGVLPSGARTSLPAERFGPYGVIVLRPMAGEAALADANGRFYIVIQGGKLGPGRRLRPTSGSLRLADKDQKRLVRALRKSQHCVCDCVATAEPATGRSVARSTAHEEADPPLAGVLPSLTAMAGISGDGSDERLSRESGQPRRFGPPSFHLSAGSGDGGGGGAGGNGGYDSDDITGSIKPTPALGAQAGFEVSSGMEPDTAHVAPEDEDPARSTQRLAAISAAQNHAEDAPTGNCARYVGDAIRASGVQLDHIGGDGNAKDMGPSLTKAGFTVVGNDQPREPGDVAVIQASPKDSAGHAAIWDGKQWISDYQQGGFKRPDLPYPNDAYRNANTPYQIYRWPQSKK